MDKQLTQHWTTFPSHFDYFEREDRTIMVNTIMADDVRSLVELAMGTGIMPKLLRQAGYKGEYVGSDCIENFINISKVHNPDETIVFADLNDRLPFADCQFHAAMLFTGLGYCNDLEATFKELKRIVKKYIYISQFNLFTEGENNLRFLRGEGWGNQYNKRWFDEMLERLHLTKILEAEIINGKDYWAMEGVPTSKRNYFLKLGV